MQTLPRWRNILILKASFIATLSSSHLASFHSTSALLQKWKNKWNSDVRRDHQPSKNYIRYVTRQKRADAKTALKGLLYNSGSSRFVFQDDKMDDMSGGGADHDHHSDNSNKRIQSKSSVHRGNKADHRRMKRKFKQDSFSDDEYPETLFQATFGNKWYTWSFNPRDGFFSQNSETGFEWREHSNRTNGRNREWQNESDVESDQESSVERSSCDRTILGLPPKGPLNKADVKNAFRLSALKWHPDKNQGPSQAMAEEKFKLCVNAYNSLCRALSSA